MATRKQLDDQSASFNPYGMSHEKFTVSQTMPSQGSAPLSMDVFGKDGHWGVEKTAQRIVDFVVTGSGDDLERLKLGREGVMRGLKEAEKAWGGTLPGISYDTIDKVLATIDEKINDLGGNIVNIAV